MWQTDGWAVAMAVYFTFFKQAESCYPWGLDSSNSSWLDSRESKLVLAYRVGTLTQLVLIKSAKIEIFHNSLYLMVFINEYTLLSFPFTSVVHPGYICWYTVLIFWSITLMVKCYDDYVSNSSLLSDCSQLIKRGKSLLKAPTLIHPPSQCDQCVQQLTQLGHGWENGHMWI